MQALLLVSSSKEDCVSAASPELSKAMLSSACQSYRYGACARWPATVLRRAWPKYEVCTLGSMLMILVSRA